MESLWKIILLFSYYTFKNVSKNLFSNQISIPSSSNKVCRFYIFGTRLNSQKLRWDLFVTPVIYKKFGKSIV